MRRLSSLMRSLSGGQSESFEAQAFSLNLTPRWLPPNTGWLTFPESDTLFENKTIFQAFEWHIPSPTMRNDASQSHYDLIEALLPHLAALGISHIWLPPGCKATSVQDNGYGIYDLWDLGEFDAKTDGRPSRTKWGTKHELENLCAKADEAGISVLFDAVLNHKAAADGKEVSMGVKVDPEDRTKVLSHGVRELETWTKFTFSGRNARYSDLNYSWLHFSGVDYDSRKKETGIFRLIREGRHDWAQDVSKELGNYDYLMFADIDHSHPAVRQDIFNWGTWITKSLRLGGMRLDAIKHYSLSFLEDFLSHLDRQDFGKELFFVGEYWSSNSKELEKIIKQFGGRLNLFDVQLVYTFSDFSKGRKVDFRSIFEGTLVHRDPLHAVTFVANHDTQEGQSLAAPVDEWFVPLAYSITLLRSGGTPCVFWGDVFGTAGPRPRLPTCGGKLARLLAARKLYAHGTQKDYFDQADCVGWTRFGHSAKSNGAGLAVVLSISWDRRSKRMFVGNRHCGEHWRDVMGWEEKVVVIDSHGSGLFPVGFRCVSVWTSEKAPGFEKISRFSFPRFGHNVSP